MVLIRFATILAAASMLLTAAAEDATPTTTTVTKPITTPTVTLAAPAQVSIGCFATSTPLESHGEYKFQSPGNCQLVCLQEGKNVFAVSDGTTCWCGDKFPPRNSLVDNSTCDSTCAGTDVDLCGGANKLWVVLTGNTRNSVDYAEPVVSSSSKLSSAVATSRAAQNTPSSTPTKAAEEKQDSKPNTAGIAAGVVVGIVGLAAIIGGVWFFLRRRRQKQAEDDYRNAANVDQFVSGGKLHTSNSSMNDSRIDPSFGDRRQSNGSIADNEDYSRRILKVTNV